MNNINNEGPLFIIGMPRSGTKLLRSLLNENPLISIPTIETEFLPLWRKKWNSFGDLSDFDNFKQFYKFNLKLPYFDYMKSLNSLIDQDIWFNSCQNYKITGVFEALIRHDSDATVGSNIIWGDKSPSYIRHTLFLKHMYPKAKFIHIIRDVRDYCLSINKAWGKNIYRAAQRWTTDVQQAKNDSLHLGNNYIEIKYEELLSDTENQLSKLCEFLSVPYSSKMLKLSQPSENLGDTIGELLVQKNNMNKYITRMNSVKRNFIESIAKNVLTDTGYLISYRGPTKSIGRFRLLTYQCTDGICLFLRSIKQENFLVAINKRWQFYRASGNRDK